MEALDGRRPPNLRLGRNVNSELLLAAAAVVEGERCDERCEQLERLERRERQEKAGKAGKSGKAGRARRAKANNAEVGKCLELASIRSHGNNRR